MNNYIKFNEKEKLRIAFMLQVPSYWPSLESVYYSCLNDERIDVKVFWLDESPIEKAQLGYSDDFFSDNKIVYEKYNEDEFRKFRAHVAFYQPSYDMSYRMPNALTIHIKRMGTRIVYIPYGIEISDTLDARAAHFNSFVVENAWRIYTFSKDMQKEYIKYCPNRKAVKFCGLPKFDAFYNEKIEKDKLINNLANKRKKILWKMHFPKLIYYNSTMLQVTPYINEYIKFARLLDDYKDIFFVVMPHPMFFSETINDELRLEAMKLLDEIRRHSNVYIDMRDDYRKSLFNVDGIIIDRSALMVEAALVDVPVLYMENSDYKEPLTEPIQRLIDTYYHGNSCTDMKKFVDEFRKNNIHVSNDQRKILDNIFIYRDGKNGERVKNDIIESLVKENEKQKIKIVIFGLGRLCEYYLDYLGLWENERYQIVAFSDNNQNKWGQKINGIKVIQPKDLIEIDYDCILIMTENYHRQIKKQLVCEYHLDDQNIIRLDYFCEFYNVQDNRK